MCDSWVIDELQAIVEINSNILLFPGWSNAADYADTKETFGFVPHHPQEVRFICFRDTVIGKKNVVLFRLLAQHIDI